MIILIAMAMTAIPLLIAYKRDVTMRTYYAVGGLALASPILPLPFKLIWFAAMGLAIFGPKDGARAPRNRQSNGALSLLVISALLVSSLAMIGASAQAVTYEHHARRNWVQDNPTGQCLWKLHMDVYWSDSGNLFTAGPRFTKDRTNCIYHFLNWAPDVPDGGQYPYGTRWKYLRITAHFEACIVYHGVPGCTTETAVMWMKVDTQGYVQTDHYII